MVRCRLVFDAFPAGRSEEKALSSAWKNRTVALKFAGWCGGFLRSRPGGCGHSRAPCRYRLRRAFANVLTIALTKCA
jgi:hypothetical protein